MPAPAVALGGLAAIMAVALRALGLAYVLDTVIDAVRQWVNSAGFAAIVTDYVNGSLSDAGLSLRFTNITSSEAIKDDVDKFAAERVNAKAGTSFTSLKSLDREEFLTGVGAVVADRISSQTGARITNIYPVEKLRQELGTELARQFDGPAAGLSPGALFPQAAIALVERKVWARFDGYKPPREPADGAKAAKARERQKKYRRTHKQVWVSR